MKNNVFKVISFICILIVPMVVWLAIMVVSPDTFKALDYDLSEKREKTKIESIEELGTSGTLLTDYIADRAPFRSVLIDYYHTLQANIEKPYENSIKPTLLALLFKNGEGNSQIEVADGGTGIFGGDSLGEDETEPDTPKPQDPIEEPDDEKHIYELIETVDPTCNEEGYKKYQCTDCGKVRTDIIPATGHAFYLAGTVEPTYEDYGYVLHVCSTCMYQERTEITPKLIDESYYAPQVAGQTIIGRYNWLFYNADLEFYKGSNLLTEDELRDYLSVLQNLQDICDAKGIKLTYLIAPNKESVYPEYMPSYNIVSSTRRAQQIVDYANEYSTISISYPVDELRYADRYWRVYYKHDTHWNNMGGFIGTQVLYKKLGMDTTDPLSLIVYEEPYDFGGDLISIGGLDAKNFEVDKYYRFEYKKKIAVLSEEAPDAGDYYHATSNSENQLNFVLVGDSFRNAMIPIIRKDFSDSTFIHIDKIGDYADSIKNADVLVVESVERFDYNMYSMAKRLAAILSE